jgi:hypothetical protein
VQHQSRPWHLLASRDAKDEPPLQAAVADPSSCLVCGISGSAEPPTISASLWAARGANHRCKQAPIPLSFWSHSFVFFVLLSRRLQSAISARFYHRLYLLFTPLRDPILPPSLMLPRTTCALPTHSITTHHNLISTHRPVSLRRPVRRHP